MNVSAPKAPIEEPESCTESDEIGKRPGRRFDDAGRAAFLISAGLLCFVAGAGIVLAQVWPAPLLESAYAAGRAQYDQLVNYDDPLKSDLWVDARRPDRGVTRYDTAKAYPGVTLYSSAHAAAATLVDLKGEVLHEWRKPFSEVWDASSVVQQPRPDAFVSFDKVHLYPNGDLLAVYSGVGDTPWGLGLVKLDKDSNVIWKYLDRVHHDVEVGQDGRIYTIAHALKYDKLAGYPEFRSPMIEDFLVVLSPDGKVERRISLLDAVAKSDFIHYFDILPPAYYEDPLHTNGAKPIEGEAAANFPGVKPGDVLLSFRNVSLIAALDPETGKFDWGLRGPWFEQHDAEVLPSGNILLFDNIGNLKAGNTSRVLEFDPADMRIAWSYAGTPERPLFSKIRSGQQRLPNGNTLITESDGGRLVEVTQKGEIAWEFLNPVRAGIDDNRTAVLSPGTRIDSATLDPSFLRIDPTNNGNSHE